MIRSHPSALRSASVPHAAQKVKQVESPDTIAAVLLKRFNAIHGSNAHTFEVLRTLSSLDLLSLLLVFLPDSFLLSIFPLCLFSSLNERRRMLRSPEDNETDLPGSG